MLIAITEMVEFKPTIPGTQLYKFAKTQVDHQALLELPFPVLWPGNSLQAVGGDNCRAYSFLFSQGSLSCAA